MSDLGLVSVFPAGVLTVLGLLTVSFFVALFRRPVGWLVPLLHVLVLVVMLYGITSFIEGEPRVSAVWRHVGVISYIVHHRALDPTIDAYFNWPGFFALGAVVSEVAGFTGPLDMAGWGPLAFNLLFLAPLLMIFRWATDDPRVHWLGLWTFYSTNWVAQDHLAPQAVGFLLWLAVLAGLLTRFTPRPSIGTPRLHLPRLAGLATWANRLRDRPDGPAASPVSRGGMLVVLIAIYAATVAGHQLTPYPALLTVAALVLCAGLRPRGLPLLMLVLLGAWTSYLTTDYLIGNTTALAGSVGSVGENFHQNVTNRLAGSPDHELIVRLRLLTSGGIWALAVLGFARRFRAGRWDSGMALIAVTPFPLIILQPYGGEMILRVFLFTLPAMAFFIACLTFPTRSAGTSRRAWVAATLVGCVLLGAFQYTRYGNERLDRFTGDDVAAVRALYRLAPPHAPLFAGSANIPWRYRDYANYDYGFVTELSSWKGARRPDPLALLADIRARSRGRTAFVIVTRSTETQARLLDGKPGALEGLVRVLLRDPAAGRLFHNRGADVFYVRSTAGGQAATSTTA